MARMGTVPAHVGIVVCLDPKCRYRAARGEVMTIAAVCNRKAIRVKSGMNEITTAANGEESIPKVLAQECVAREGVVHEANADACGVETSVEDGDGVDHDGDEAEDSNSIPHSTNNSVEPFLPTVQNE